MKANTFRKRLRSAGESLGAAAIVTVAAVSIVAVVAALAIRQAVTDVKGGANDQG